MPLASNQFEALLAGLKATGLTSGQIAEHAGISRDTVWRLENGIARQPTLDTYLALGRVYQRELGRPPPPLCFGRR